MLLHASCAVRGEVGVLIRGRSGSGKSSLLLRLLGRGFDLVADDCVLVEGGVARAPDTLAGLIEVRGMGVYRRGFRPEARIRLVIEAGLPTERVATRRLCPELAQPVIRLDLLGPATCDAVCVAVDCLAGLVDQVAGPI